MTKRLLLATIFPLALLASFPAKAQITPLQSFAYASDHVPCGGTNDLMTFRGDYHMWAANPPSSGIFPGRDFWIRAVSLSHYVEGDARGASAVVGRYGPQDGAISQWITTGSAMTQWNGDAAPLFVAKSAQAGFLDVRST